MLVSGDKLPESWSNGAMTHFLSVLDKLLAAAPTLLSDQPRSSRRRREAQPGRWAEILHTIYDGVLHEPVPQRLAEMVRRERPSGD
jgi:hypothetical protein